MKKTGSLQKIIFIILNKHMKLSWLVGHSGLDLPSLGDGTGQGGFRKETERVWDKPNPSYTRPILIPNME